jgi:hypothetical protein
MGYFTINTLGDTEHEEYCFTDNMPEGLGVRSYRLAKGVAFGTEYPADIDEVRLRLGEDYLGLKRASFLGNTSGFLPVDAKTADIILSHKVGTIERMPFLLIDHKGRVHSRDYVFLNPLERIDCLNLDLSVVRRSKKGEIKDVKNVVLQKASVPNLDLFRLGELSDMYLFSSALVDALTSAGCTNFVFDAVESR